MVFSKTKIIFNLFLLVFLGVGGYWVVVPENLNSSEANHVVLSEVSDLSEVTEPEQKQEKPIEQEAVIQKNTTDFIRQQQDLLTQQQRCDPKISQAKKQQRRFEVPEDTEIARLMNLDFDNYSIEQYGEIIRECREWIDSIDQAIDAKIGYAPFDDRSLEYFHSIKNCQAFEAKAFLSVVMDKGWKTDETIKFFKKSAESKDWDAFLKLIGPDKTPINQIFTLKNDIPRHLPPENPLDFAILNKAPKNILERLLDLGATVNKKHYQYSVRVENVEFLELMYERGENLNVTIGHEGLFDYATRTDKKAVFPYLDRYGVNPNLQHGADSKDLLYRQLEKGNRLAAKRLINYGAYVGNEHLLVAPSELLPLLEKVNCEKE